MGDQILVKPLPHKTRQRTFGFLIFVFVTVIPLLYLYATGYRLDLQKPTNLVSTGGVSVTVNESGAKIFIDDEPVRTARVFSKAFYAQGIDAGTHRIYVQKEGFHTWVKELPVSERLVTEAIAFNLPLVPQVHVLSKWQTATGTPVLFAQLTSASTTNEVIATTTKITKTFVASDEYNVFLRKFSTTSTSTVEETPVERIKELLDTSTTTAVPESEDATTTITSGNVRLQEKGNDLYATWIGSFEEMPYYYCAQDFPRYSSTTATNTEPNILPGVASVLDSKKELEEEIVIHPVQTVPKDVACVPSIKIDRKDQEIYDFDFFPGSTDFVIIARTDGVYVVEIDDRSWQNVQPVLLGTNLQFILDNGDIYIYDGILIYRLSIELD